MAVFDLNAMKMEIIEGLTYVGSNPILLMINNECHVILGSNSKCHYKLNLNQKRLDLVYEFAHLSAGLHENGAVHIKSKNMLLLFGGYDYKTDNQFNEIWKFDLSTGNKWVKLQDIKLPKKMSNFAWVLTKNEQYMIIFGGYCGERMKNIFILDLNEMKFYCSNVRLCDQGYPCAVSMHSGINSDLLIAGFIRNVSKEYDMNIPLELMKLFHTFFDSEIVYLVHHSYNKKDRLYQVELNDILKEKSTDLSLDCF